MGRYLYIYVCIAEPPFIPIKNQRRNNKKLKLKRRRGDRRVYTPGAEGGATGGDGVEEIGGGVEGERDGVATEAAAEVAEEVDLEEVIEEDAEDGGGDKVGERYGGGRAEEGVAGT